MQHLLLITNDLFDIASRLKSVDENYLVYYNAKTQKFEVHNSCQQGSTLAFVLPFDELDARAVCYALHTRSQNAKNIFEEVERHNAKVDKDKQYQLVNNALQYL